MPSSQSQKFAIQARTFIQAECILTGKSTIGYGDSHQTLKNPAVPIHLSNHHAKKYLNVTLCNIKFMYKDFPKYSGVLLDCSLAYCQYLTKTVVKIKASNNIIHKPAGTNWGR